MSKLKRLLGALSLVSLFIFSSCVDDEIAPEITAIRQAQIDLLNADVAFRNAETALKNAEVEKQNIANQYASASNAIKLQAEQATLDQQLLTLQVNTAKAEADLLAAELAAEEAADDLAQYLAQAGLNEAAEYLAGWRAVMNGGTVTLPSAPDFTVARGLNTLRNDLITDLSELATMQLFLSGDTIPQAYVDSLLAVDLANARASKANSEATLAAREAMLTALRAEETEFDEAFAILEERLLELAQDSLEAKMAVESAQAVVDSVKALVTDANNVISDFQDLQDGVGTDDLDFGDLDIAQFNAYGGPYSDNYLDAVQAQKDINTAITAHAKDSAIFADYAAALSTALDDVDTAFKAIDAELKQLVQDSTDAANAVADAAGSAQEEELAVEEAWVEYVAAERLIKKLLVVDGDDPSTADSAAYVQARKAWDGRPTNEILNVAGGGDATLFDHIDDIIATNDVTANTLSGGTIAQGGNFALTWTDPFDVPNSLDAEGGALQTYETATEFSTLQEALEDAVFALSSVRPLYEDVSNILTRLQGIVSDIEGGDWEAQTAPTYTVPADLASTSLFFDFLRDVNEAAKIVNGTSPTTGVQLGKDQDDLLSALDNARDDLADLEEELAFAAQIVAPYLEDYEAAVEFTSSGVNDEVALALVTPTFNLSMAQMTFNNISNLINDVQAEVADLEASYDELIVTDGLEIHRVTLQSKIDALAGTSTTTGSIQTAKDAIASADESIAELIVMQQKAAIGQVEAEALIAEKEQEIAELQAEIAFLEQIAAEFQALLEASLAG